ncbi:PAS domain S-box protein [Pseudovibrio sp. SPO723]|uniref:PAS domain-containing hybrid sensor histidine kinase/response regulator n=1 Tax=Nesiotobacter zosterae TaxID=392721 RepID=UPI0029C58E56|nr:PAS domain S-box protein [Pseudovibrio sp. SPO723]MDX5595678.1 PAS domain S-box protein [Pseudovibrio sp. SPO723]
MATDCCPPDIESKKRFKKNGLLLGIGLAVFAAVVLLQITMVALVQVYAHERAYRALLDTLRSELIVALRVVSGEGRLQSFLTRLDEPGGLSVNALDGAVTIRSFPLSWEELRAGDSFEINGLLFSPFNEFHMHSSLDIETWLGHDHEEDPFHHSVGAGFLPPAMMPSEVLQRQLAERITTSLRFVQNVQTFDGNAQLLVAAILPLEEPVAITIEDSLEAGFIWNKELQTLYILFGLSYFLLLVCCLILFKARLTQEQMALVDLSTECDTKGAMLLQQAEDARLHASQVNSVLSSVSDAILTLDLEGRIVMANRAALLLFETDKNEIAGTQIGQWISPNKVDLSDLFANRLTEEQEKDLFVHPQQIDLEQSDGGLKHIEMIVSDFFQRDGRHFSCVLRDVTERVEAEQEAAEAQNRLYQAINHLPDAFVLFDQEDRLLICNDRYKEIYRRSADLFVAGNTFEHIVRTGAERGQYELDGMSVDQWVAQRMKDHQHAKNEVIQRLNDGSWVRVSERKTPDGLTVGFRSDITELKRHEEAVLAREAELRSIFTSALDAIIGIDENDQIIEFNKAAEVLLGHKREDVLGLEAHRLLFPRQEWQNYLMVVSALKRLQGDMTSGNRREATVLDRDGNEIAVELSMNVAQVPSGKRFYAFLHDVRARIRAIEELQQAKEVAENATQAKTAFLAMMSHEIRTPLSAVIGFLQLLQAGKLSAKQADYVNTCVESAEALLKILNDILDLSKLEAGKLEFKAEPVDIGEVVEQVQDLLLPRAQELGLQLNVDVSDDVPQLVLTDQGRVRQLLINLTNNALKFTPQGHVTIRAESHRQPSDPKNCSIRLSVIDTGIGIPREKQQSIFHQFATIDSEQARKTDGVGLGLAICRELVEGLGGRIGLQSVPDKGSVFWVELDVPLYEGEADPVSPPAAEPASIPSPRHTAEQLIQGKHFLIAEDSEPNRMVLTKLIEASGARVEQVENGQQAIDALEHSIEDPFDAVFMDVSMPVLDGIAATRSIRGRPDLLSSIPIVGLTAHAGQDDHKLMYAAGFTTVLTKPIKKQAIEEALQKLFISQMERARERKLGPPQPVTAFSLPQPLRRPTTRGADDSALLTPVQTKDELSLRSFERLLNSFDESIRFSRSLLNSPRIDVAEVETLCDSVEQLSEATQAEGLHLLASKLHEQTTQAASGEQEALSSATMDICRNSLFALSMALEQARSRLIGKTTEHPPAEEKFNGPQQSIGER